jgi:hypothetical protein
MVLLLPIGTPYDFLAKFFEISGGKARSAPYVGRFAAPDAAI